MLFKKKNKIQKTDDEIYLYIVTEKYDVNSFPEVLKNLEMLTIVQSEDNAKEYIDKRLRLDYKDHFISWCSLRELDYKDYNSWLMYRNTCGIQNDKYMISPVKYTKNMICELLRVYTNCIPLGCSYDGPVEQLTLMTTMSKVNNKTDDKKEDTTIKEKTKYDA